MDTIAGLAAGTITPKPQDQSLATLAPILRKEDGRLDWTRPAAALACRTRGFHPWPGAWTSFGGTLLKVLRARPEAPGAGQPGEVAAVDRDGIVVGCAQGTRLRLLEVQAESRKAMTAAAFAAGARLTPGARFR
jgi:methionyl-tRNA formyltransferase